MKVKDKILTTATGLFHHQGYRATGINQIIEEAGIAKGSFYYNFKSKEALCIAFLERRHIYWMEALEKYVVRHRQKSNEEPILLAFDFLSFMNKKENFRGCSFLNILSEISDDNRAILSVIQDHKTDLRNYIGTLAVNSLLRDHLYLLFEGALIESQLFKNQWPIDQAKKIVKSLIK
ncbi:TetR/AcrR family transcriptional regulator [Fulvivirgaceae bacterium BMA12]|uniref:TetR/AcrR family transcriptional regulator n=1 Tax=Agaribacillus aureus TaxID=3051825 RepID=A0ABT8L608_9BACT|nr:TetR/AcrR family transcriptional regulator [Fulvivirgaceae bacterium BMA12]